MLWVVKRWQPDRNIAVVAAHSFAAVDGLEAVQQAVTVVTQLRPDAALYEPAPVRQGGQRAAPASRGRACPGEKRFVESWPFFDVGFSIRNGKNPLRLTRLLI
jgi:hypothetical protein